MIHFKAPNRAIMTAAALGITLLASGCASDDRGAKKADLAASRVTTIGVNSYLWRASLDALSKMPLLQADANSGVIITDWYANPANPGERMKVSVSIIDQDLRALFTAITHAVEIDPVINMLPETFFMHMGVAILAIMLICSIVLQLIYRKLKTINYDNLK